MFGQMTPIAPPLQSTMADLRALLEILSDPSKVKSALDSISSQVKALDEKQQALSVKEPEMAGLQKTLEEKEQYLKAWEAELELKAKEVLVKLQAAAKREKDVAALEASQTKRFEDTKVDLDESLSVIQAREKAAEQKLAEASEELAKAEGLRSEYAAKLEKLKAVVG